MKIMWTSFIVAVAGGLLWIPKVSLASDCAAVYANATRNVDVFSRTLTEQNSLYTKHCESNGSMRQASKGLDLTIPIETIVIEFSGNQEEAQSEM